MSYQRRPVAQSVAVTEIEFRGTDGRAPSRLGRTLDQPPGGTCGARLSCRNPATKWIGMINDTPHGSVKRFAVGVCDHCFALITSGKLASPVGGLLDPSDTTDTLGGCDASTAESAQTIGELRVLPPAQEST